MTLLTAVLHAEVDVTKLPAGWTPSEPPEALTSQLAREVECKDYLILLSSKATLIHNENKIVSPYFGKGYDAAIKGIQDGFDESAAAAKIPIIKSELVKKDGVEILHQEVIQAHQYSIVLSQLEPAKIDQVMLIFPEDSPDHDAIVAAGYSVFRSVPDAKLAAAPPTPASGGSPASSTTTIAATDPLDAEAFGRLSFYVVLVVGVLIFIVSAIRKRGRQKPREPRP